MSRTHQAGSHYRVEAGLQGSTVNEAKTGFDGLLAGCKQMETGAPESLYRVFYALKEFAKKWRFFLRNPFFFSCAKW